MIRSFSAISIALMSWLASYVTNASYEYTTWQCVVSLVLIDIVFMYLTSISSRIDCIRTDYMCLAFFSAIVYLAPFAIITCLMECAYIPSDSGIYAAYSSTFGTVGFAISLIILIIAILPNKILEGLDNAARFTCFVRSYVHSDTHGNKNTKEGSK